MQPLAWTGVTGLLQMYIQHLPSFAHHSYLHNWVWDKKVPYEKGDRTQKVSYNVMPTISSIAGKHQYTRVWSTGQSASAGSCRAECAMCQAGPHRLRVQLLSAPLPGCWVAERDGGGRWGQCYCPCHHTQSLWEPEGGRDGQIRYAEGVG